MHDKLVFVNTQRVGWIFILFFICLIYLYNRKIIMLEQYVESFQASHALTMKSCVGLGD